MKSLPVPQLKIAMIGSKGVPAIFGGVERSVEELSTRLVQMGHAVTVYGRRWYTNTQGKTTYKGLRIVTAPTIHTKHLDTIVYTFSASVHALFGGYDIIHYHGVGPALLAWIPRIFAPRVKVVISFQSIDREHAKWGWFARKMLHLGEWAAAHFSHVVLASSEMIQKYIEHSYNVNPVYLPNGATIPHAEQSMHEQELIARFGLRTKQYLVVVTRLVAHKGVHEIIAAYKQARKEQPAGFAGKRLVIVGDTSFTDAYAAQLKALAENDSDVVFTGYQSGAVLSALMRQAYMAVHASHSEGLPMSVIEVMAHGVPVLVSDIAPHLEVVESMKWHFPVGDVPALKDALIRLVVDTQEVVTAGKQVQAFVSKRYSWDHIARTLSAIYANILPNKRYASLPPLLYRRTTNQL